jgi:hypothetical protein
VTRAAAIAGFALVTACAHVEAPQLAPLVDDGALALRRCIEYSDACPALAMRLEAKLRDHYDTSAAHRLAWQITEAFGRGDASVVGTAIVRCRAGRHVSCRALWWALGRLYLADDATLARANECGLTDAVASAFKVER